jgi:hypothetical protein
MSPDARFAQWPWRDFRALSFPSANLRPYGGVMDGFDVYREDYEAMSAEEARTQRERLISDRNEHPEYLIHQAWTALWRSFDIYTDNVSELRALLAAAETNEQLQIELFQNVRAPTVRTAYFRRLDKALHNSLAGAVSLVDHTRRHVAENFPETIFSSDFESKNSIVYKMPESTFLRRFRNYLLHVGHAPFKMTGTLAVKSGETGTLTVWLISEELLSVENVWTAPARTLIENHPDGIHLRAVVDVYGQSMLDLYHWVFDQQPVLRPDGLNILNEFTRRINLTMSSGTDDGRHMQEFWEHVARNADAVRAGRPQTNWQDIRPPD